jgi:hypothetical protein
MSLFALPFAAVGVFMLGWVGKNGLDAWQMQSWQPVSAQVTSAGYETHSGDGTTYKAYASYDYSWRGQGFTGNRVAMDDMADNIGDYQTEIASRLSRAQRNGEPITVYVNPEQPWESIIDRDIRWGMIGFKLIFGLVFGGVGFGLLYAVFKAPEEKDAAEPLYSDKPWLLNDDWQTETLRSNSKNSMWGAWAFAALWNLISSPTPFLAYREIVEKENYVAIVALLFPLVGMLLLYWAIKRTLEWRRFGPAPLTLDPFPGSIGGHVGGTIELNQRYDSQARYQLTLTSISSYISGSGKNRSRREKAQWQDKLVAHSEMTATGTRLTFRFDVPEGLGESDAEQDTDSYNIWRLNLHAELAGPDIDRDYDIPVYATGEKSRRMSERAVQSARSEQNRIDDEAVQKSVDLRRGMHGTTLHYPMFRHLDSMIIGLVFGAIFGGAGWFLVFKESHAIFGSVFGSVGLLIGIFSLYMGLNSLQVSQDGMSIRTVRRILGIPVKRREMRRDAFDHFDKKSSMQKRSGSKSTMYYSVYAVDTIGNRMAVGEGFKGDNEANAAIRLFTRELGIGDVLA